MLKWMLIIVGSLAGLVALVALIGAMLPRGHVAAKRVRMKAPVDAVWAALTDYPGQAAWRQGVSRIERLADHDGHEVWNEVLANGQAMPLETLEATPPRRLVRKIADPKLPFGGTWTYELAAAEGGCELRITERGEVYNPIFRFVSRFMDPGATIDAFMRSLGSKFGEPVTPQAVTTEA